MELIRENCSFNIHSFFFCFLFDVIDGSSAPRGVLPLPLSFLRIWTVYSVFFSECGLYKKHLTIITKRSILNVVAALDPPLICQKHYVFLGFLKHTLCQLNLFFDLST